MNFNFKLRHPNLSACGASFRKLIQLTWVGLCLLVPGIMVSNVKAEVETEISPMVAKSQVISPTDPAKSISITLVLPLSKPEEAAEYAQRVSSPKDALYGKFLTPQEFASRFGANENDYEAAKSWATQNGLTISLESISRTTLTVSGTVSQFEQLFNVQMNDYRSPQGDEFSSVSAEPRVPKALSSILMTVVGLNGAPAHLPSAVVKRLGENPSGGVADVIFNPGTGPGGGFTPADIQAAYAIPAQLGGTTPQTVAVFETSGFYPEEIEKFIKYNQLPNVRVTPRPVTKYGGGIWYPYEQQTVVDVDMIIGTNPALREVLVYEDAAPNIGGNMHVSLMDVLSAVADDNKAQTLDISYFLDERSITKSQVKAEAQKFTQLAAQGITVVAAAGDGETILGDLGGNYICDPATQPMVTAVGGTALSASYQGNFISSYVTEEVWNTVLEGVDFATGGGYSQFWPIPSWQTTADPTYNGGSAKKRNVPDVSAVASPGTPVAVYLLGGEGNPKDGGWALVGGTGVASGIWTGFISILNAARETTGLGPIGFFNPALYSLPSHSYLFGYIFNDVLYGNNGVPIYPYGGFDAGPGYDDCTGWGSMYGPSLAATLLLMPTQTGTAPAAFGGLSGSAQATTANLTWTPSQGATGYLVCVGVPGVGPLFFDYVSSGPSIEVTGLIPGTTYLAEVIALNRSGWTDCDTEIYLSPENP